MAPISLPYIPLLQRQIRILVLLPGRDEDDLCGLMEHQTLPEHVPTSKHMKLQRKDKLEEDMKLMDERLDYEAISYVWGSPALSHQLWIPELPAPMLITRSLWEALKRLRLTDRPRRVWADAICINQLDIPERNAQVAMMADVYACARAVLVWLGESTESEAVAFSCINTWNRREAEILHSPEFEERDRTWYGDFFDALRKRPAHATLDDLGLDARSIQDIPQAMDGIRALTRRPWFSRVWTVQETSPALVDKVIFHCGSHSATKIENGIRALMETAPSLSQDDALVADAYYHVASGGYFDLGMFRPDTAIRALVQYSMRSCTDPRDRIFAFRKLLGATGLETLRPDYHLPVAEVYRRFVTCCITNGNQSFKPHPRCNLALILALVGTESSPHEEDARDWPTWVPHLDDLSGLSRGKRRLYEQSGETCLAHHTRKSAPSARARWVALLNRMDMRPVPGAEEQLMVRGKPFAMASRPLCSVIDDDLLSKLGAATTTTTSTSDHDRHASDGDDKQHITQFISYISKLCHHIDNTVPNDPEDLAIFLYYLVQTLPEANHNVQIPFTALVHLCEHYRRPSHEIYSTLDSSTLQQIRLLMHHLYRTDDLIRLHLWLIQSNDNTSDVAWLPARTRCGDRLCYFGGGLFPFVIRPIEEEEGKYVLVGDGHSFSTVPFPGVRLPKGEMMGLMDMEGVEKEEMGYVTLV